MIHKVYVGNVLKIKMENWSEQIYVWLLVLHADYQTVIQARAAGVRLLRPLAGYCLFDRKGMVYHLYIKLA